ncbi:MAG: hypothetical protein HOJ29_00450 [Candidatus Magasanikbacteria bacterium]|nr:hypothetical protein [Candidatus Magasanikbacteria bacterium]
MKKEIIETLQTLGLQQEQIRVYTTIFEHKELTVANIVKKTSLKKGTIYNICDWLEEHTLIYKNPQKKVLHYTITHPENLKEFLYKKRKALIETEKKLEEHFGTLEAAYSKINNDPFFKNYPGIQGIRQVLEKIILDEPKELKSYSVYMENEEISTIFHAHLEKRAKKNITVKLIRGEDCPSSLKKEPTNTLQKTEHLRERKTLKDFKTNTASYIYEDVVIFLSVGELPGGVYIKHKDIADQQNAIFDHLFNKRD